MGRVYQDENHAYQFDFTTATWSSNDLHDIFSQNGAGILSDVDFIAETEDELFLIEYKNANISGAAHPEKFEPMEQKRENKIAFKYYDSWIYLKSIQKSKPITYIYILEYPNGDSVTRKRIRNRIAALLPFQLQKLPQIKENMLSAFEVLSIDEWNSHKKYGQFPIQRVST
jgi:hypothetical protein